MTAGIHRLYRSAEVHSRGPTDVWPTYDVGDRRSSGREQATHPHRVTDRGGEPEPLGDPRQSSVTECSEQAHRLHPPEGLFDPFAHGLTDDVARIAWRASIDGTPPGALAATYGFFPAERTPATNDSWRHPLLPPTFPLPGGRRCTRASASSRSAMFPAGAAAVSTTRPWRLFLSIRTVAVYARRDVCPFAFRHKRLSRSVVD